MIEKQTRHTASPQHLPPSPTEADLSFADALKQQFGSDVAAEVPMIMRLLPEILSELGCKQSEGDLEGVCRYRLEKRELHKAQTADDSFERVRLMNMLYEKALKNLKILSLADSSELEEGELKENTIQIISHLDETLDYSAGGAIASQLHELYAFMLGQLQDSSIALREAARDVTLSLEPIYLGYLELEIRGDIETYLKQ